ncbi:uncharacterized protein LOC127856002 [Dreissena polymorpha]|uniref:uncharacterized protein LOC127856002 n=1 Tax=Dreissena polymorpha TaxID=45954 RepID=UPI002264F91C|nr:uncharacterized protein LOC127856002 [Dreissena polymorpha]
MYKDTSGYNRVHSCAVSPDGDMIYVVNYSRCLLVTLSRDGTVISDLSVPAQPTGIHVTESGQVLLCGYSTDKIFQVDRDGRQILAEMVTQNDGVTHPISIYYSKHTGSLIVGMWNNNDIIVFKALLE